MTDGKIAYVGPVSGLKAPAGAKVMNLSGKFVMPGIIDSHVHIGMMHDVTQDEKYETPENCPGRSETVCRLRHHLGAGAGHRQGFRPRPAQPAAQEPPHHGAYIQRRPGRGHERRLWRPGGRDQPISTPEEARKLVDEQAAKGVDFIKLWMDDERKTIPVKMTYDVSRAWPGRPAARSSPASSRSAPSTPGSPTAASRTVPPSTSPRPPTAVGAGPWSAASR